MSTMTQDDLNSARIGSFEKRVDERFNRVDERLQQVDGRLETLEERMYALHRMLAVGMFATIAALLGIIGTGIGVIVTLA
ncbi:MAG TPA: hypothetical protein VMT37_07500 [Solirubrobacterales bacterium]|nr:hypothetical protein [Solirubrobacterales bacterium]